ncbi:DUF1289 domain-containing protein [Colwellia sp. 4_MG-2023]|uniref:DUF1289 domain-containing protein n=1 Tax=unclassified Colwellia TaxID=196834 RepID=UPI001C07F5F2|nr:MULTISPECIES: DUF1289 domain-containing protein [unclassified Colwellia]MBU2925541.1 DUF1289 domain-containing protein [Colwellia sp. C2M11]MDO6489212.1 DUF1289 domain-containing protein [Colwellia sp. 6_MG-2023]MDO6508820.1 DUF1289 domain-containing protein [Colwellia sp. 5_MG-2023]MDO6557506.1 DUF1289 domain-containing protein [Colwellia sp. 4_MG-2023]MDO6651490.1 DUF1289 domain-containing protein [Colwellia sp. 3_MG-2023]
MQLEFFDIPSPCVEVCQSNEKGYCLGCMRTREERKEWVHLDNDTKQKVIKRCIQRKKRQKNKENPKAIEVAKTLPEQQVEQPSLLDEPKKITLSDDKALDFGDFEL